MACNQLNCLQWQKATRMCYLSYACYTTANFIQAKIQHEQEPVFQCTGLHDIKYGTAKFECLLYLRCFLNPVTARG